MSAIVSSNELSDFPLHIDGIVDAMMTERRNYLQSIEGALCKAFQTGKCAQGANCKFRHSRGMKEGQCCKHYMRQLCKKGDQCEFLHIYDMSKMPECQFFRDYGVCGNNEECVFLHVTPESKIKECIWYQRGFCSKGPSCKHAHIRRELCPRYLAGFCYLGPECPFAHPRHDLQQRMETDAPAPVPRNNDGDRGEGDYGRNRGGPGRQDGGYNRGQQGHEGRRQPMNLQNVMCYKCKQMGHFANACPN